MGIIIKNLDEFKKNYGLVMDFWNDSIMFTLEEKHVFSINLCD
jgi:hypothetical protein